MSTPALVEYEIIDLLCSLVQTQLALPDQTVWIFNQKQNIPDRAGLFVVAEFLGAKPFGTNARQRTRENGDYVEDIGVNIQETYKLVLYSRDESAFTRAWEVLAALNGNAAQQLQEQYAFQLANLPTAFIDTSAVEATARLFRQDITFNAIRFRTKTNVIQYFDKFQIPPTVHTNQ